MNNVMHIVNFKYKYPKGKKIVLKWCPVVMVITSGEKTIGLCLFNIHTLSIFLVNKYISSSWHKIIKKN